MKLLRFGNGIFPVIPGTVIQLGEYGYWKDQQWCRVGNISDIPDMKRYFSVETISLGHLMEDSLGVEFSGGIGTDSESSVIKENASMEFMEKGAMYFRGILKEEIRYISLEGEIKPFLMKLRDLGLWEPKYWLAYSIIKAEDFISLRSLASGVSAKIGVASRLEEVSGSSVGLTFNFKKEEISVEKATPSDSTEAIYAGARFISLERKNLFSKKLTLRYNMSSDSCGWDYEDVAI